MPAFKFLVRLDLDQIFLFLDGYWLESENDSSAGLLATGHMRRQAKIQPKSTFFGDKQAFDPHLSTIRPGAIIFQQPVKALLQVN